ncbi:hypothetical protein ACFSJY_19185 [Thalassotalea euphylliae]|uniref:hypothetical protein n=1 Tax=Thalassotalea euphylliae TaxID=1655234 RepID=UPI003644D115
MSVLKGLFKAISAIIGTIAAAIAIYVFVTTGDTTAHKERDEIVAQAPYALSSGNRDQLAGWLMSAKLWIRQNANHGELRKIADELEDPTRYCQRGKYDETACFSELINRYLSTFKNAEPID